MPIYVVALRYAVYACMFAFVSLYVGRLNGDVVEATSEVAGLPLRYSFDDGQTWSDYKPGLRLEPAQTVTLVAT